MMVSQLFIGGKSLLFLKNSAWKIPYEEQEKKETDSNSISCGSFIINAGLGP